jgi:hypothetical protein
VQYFKGDDVEKKFEAAAAATLDALSSSKHDFFVGAYSAAPLGEIIYDSSRSPLTNAITRSIFASSFSEIFDAFVHVGTFEAYLTVFRKIFGSDVDVEFTVPAAGKLTIAIIAQGVEENILDVRQIESNAYVLYDLVDESGNTIVVQTLKGFESQYELEQMLFEMVPAGIFTTITLTLAEG